MFYAVLLAVLGVGLSTSASLTTAPTGPSSEPTTALPSDPPALPTPPLPSFPSVSEPVSVLNAPLIEPARPAPGLLDGIALTEQAEDDNVVFAHYFPPYPLSIDNEDPAGDYYARNYLTVGGEDDKHRAYGGLLRDRPIGRAPLSGDWQLEDMRTEIRQAASVGIDGFTLDILAFQDRTWINALTMMRAADLEGFEIIPMLDASSIEATPERAAAAFAELFSHPSAQLIEGEHVLASFLAEAEPVAWWVELIGLLEDDYQLPIKFIAVFNNPSPTNLEAFAPISYGLGAWGYRNAAGAATSPDYAAQAHALGVKWMHTVAVQDARPRSGHYAEAGNTDTLRATWARAIESGADLVQIATWNDYSESTAIAPSVSHGWAFLELMGYYGEWFTTGSPPTVNGDHLVLTHRTQFWSAQPTSGIVTMAPTLGGSTVPPRNMVEALVFLTAPAWVTVASGDHTTTVQRPAGVSTVLVPLGVGQPSAQIVRGPRVVMTVESPYPVVDPPYVQDLQYVATRS